MLVGHFIHFCKTRAQIGSRTVTGGICFSFSLLSNRHSSAITHSAQTFRQMLQCLSQYFIAFLDGCRNISPAVDVFSHGLGNIFSYIFPALRSIQTQSLHPFSHVLLDRIQLFLFILDGYHCLFHVHLPPYFQIIFISFSATHSLERPPAVSHFLYHPIGFVLTLGLQIIHPRIFFHAKQTIMGKDFIFCFQRSFGSVIIQFM